MTLRARSSPLSLSSWFRDATQLHKVPTALLDYFRITTSPTHSQTSQSPNKNVDQFPHEDGLKHRVYWWERAGVVQISQVLIRCCPCPVSTHISFHLNEEKHTAIFQHPLRFRTICFNCNQSDRVRGGPFRSPWHCPYRSCSHPPVLREGTLTTGWSGVPGNINCICWASIAAAVFCWIKLFLPLISSWVFKCVGGWRYLQFSLEQRPCKMDNLGLGRQ